MKRPYTKKSEYWSKPRTVAAAPQPVSAPNVTFNMPPAPEQKAAFRHEQTVPFPDVVYGATDIVTAAACDTPTSSATTRGRQINSGLVDGGAFQNIRSLVSPWGALGGGESRQGYVGMKDAIDLCARAWAGVSVFRNAIEVSVEFSNQPLYIKCDNKTVETFFKEWFYAVQINKLKEQYFREFYRSGNVFLYKFSGKFGPAYYKNFQQSFGGPTTAPKVPIRYSVLNPSNIFVPTGLTYPYTYVRLLSTYEVTRLQNPITEQDKQVYQSLPPEVKTQLAAGSSNPLGIYIPMDASRLRFAFYKKQDYEPMAIPMGYPVLPDIEWKLTLKKMDMSLARSIEHAILLVTTGETGTQYNGGNGINVNNIARLQNLFSNQTIGRVLVADFTTKAQWLIPDIKDILGPEKFQIVNEDIKEGLQSILTGNDKFANAQMKAKIFIQRLEEGQDSFLNEFLMPEVVQICEAMGFRTIPTIKFRKIDLQDPAVMARIYAQLGSLGILTAEQVVKAIETSILPDESEMESGQTAYKAARDAGKYYPLVGGSQPEDPNSVPGAGGSGGRPAGSGVPKSKTTVSPIGTSKAEDVTTGAPAFSMKSIVQHVKASESLVSSITSTLKKKYKIKELDTAQQSIVQSFAKIIMATKPLAQWDKSVAATIKNPTIIPANIAQEIDDLALEHGIDAWDATILRNSRMTFSPEHSANPV